MTDFIPAYKVEALRDYVRAEVAIIPARHTRKRYRYTYDRLVSLLNAEKTTVDIDPVGLYAIHSKSVNLGTCRHFDTAFCLECTPCIHRTSDKMAFDGDGKRYLTRNIVCYTDKLVNIWYQ